MGVGSVAGTPFNRLIQPYRADRPRLWLALGFGLVVLGASLVAVLMAQVALWVVSGELDTSRGAMVLFMANVFGAWLAIGLVIWEAARANGALGELVE